ncbi:hypothetical protein WAI453_002681 [Rhynchosporium graminicola]
MSSAPSDGWWITSLEIPVFKHRRQCLNRSTTKVFFAFNLKVYIINPKRGKEVSRSSRVYRDKVIEVV